MGSARRRGGMGSSKQWLTAIDQLFDAVGREQRLAQALGGLRPFFGAQAASFFTVADPAQPGASHTGAVGLSGQLLVEYHAHYSAHDEWVKSAVSRSDFGTGAVYRGRGDLMPLDRILQTYFGRQFMARNCVTDILSGVVETIPSDGSLSWVTYFRHDEEPAFTLDDTSRMVQLVAHMRQVLRLHRRLAPQLALGATLREVVEQMELPVLFVAEDGRIADRNAAAQAALAGPSGWLAARDGRLQVCAARRWQTLSTWLPGLRQGERTNLSLDLQSVEGRSATLEIVPIQAALADTVASHPAVAICTLKPGVRDRAHALRTLHGLTAAEARVAQQLAEGRTAAEIAVATEVSLSTVRTQLAAVRGKLGVRRQAQVVAAVLAM
jgi:DNA-binding CsgD family transcriptional regulator/PAS domain-containing protein